MFPPSNAHIIRNEVGEPLGWEIPPDSEEVRAWLEEDYDFGNRTDPDPEPYDGCCDDGDWDADPDGRWWCIHCGEETTDKYEALQVSIEEAEGDRC